MRRVPPELQVLMGNQRYMRRSLGLRSTDCSHPQVLRAWASVHEAVEAQFAAARAQQEAKTLQVQPLKPRDVAAIAAEPLIQMHRALEEGEHTTDLQKSFAQTLPIVVAQGQWAMQTGDLQPLRKALAETAKPVWQSLGIAVDEETKEAIVDQMLRYAADAKADVQKLQRGDFSAPVLKAKAPPLPVKRLSWEQLLDQYVISVGGITEVDGVGIAKDRLAQYRLAIRVMCQSSGTCFPTELTTDHVRTFVNELQQSGLSANTQRKRLDALRHLFEIGIRYALVDVNPFAAFKISVPRGTEVCTYRSFSRDELKRINQSVQAMASMDRRWVIDALICLGARTGEVVKLRTTDLEQSEDGIWYLSFKHQPKHQYPTSLKGAQESERKTPLHPLLIQRGYLEYLQRKPEGYIVDLCLETSAWTGWFKREVLEKTGIYQRRKTGLHSLRNSAIDLWREAGLSAEVRRALVAHAARDVQDKVYGIGLKNMPDVLYQELMKVDLSWLS